MTDAILTAERARELFDYDPEMGAFMHLTDIPMPMGGVRVRAGIAVGWKTVDGYIAVKVDRKAYQAHRLAWLWVHGVWPPNEIDHINGIRHDNRLANLRLATKRENMQNRHAAMCTSKSGVLGVSWDSKWQKWVAQLHLNGKHIYCSRHEKLEDAIAARRAAELKHFPFAPKR